MAMSETPQRDSPKINSHIDVIRSEIKHLICDVPFKYSAFSITNIYFNLYFIAKIYYYGAVIVYTIMALALCIMLFYKIKNKMEN